MLETGSLQMTIFPTNILAAGAKWQVDDGAFQTSGTTLSGLLPGSHTVNFNTVLGWVAPTSQVVSITNTLTTSASATYTPYGVRRSAAIGRERSPMGAGSNLLVQGRAGSNCVIQVSSDLALWTSISTNTMPSNGSMLFTDSTCGQSEPAILSSLSRVRLNSLFEWIETASLFG